jgi:GMP synthase (glutamine-hydrolysing)
VGSGAPKSDPLFGALPRTFQAQVTHRDVIRHPGKHLTVIGTAPHDANHVVRAGPCAWGLQFHPEFDDVVMRLYLEVRRQVLDEELGPGAAERRIDGVRHTPHAASLLERFARVCRGESTDGG